MSVPTVRSRKFCCCIPVRIGVLMISILGIVIGALGMAAGFAGLGNNDKTASAIQIVLYVFFILISLLGFWGAFRKRRGLVRTFFYALCLHLVLNITFGSIGLYNRFNSAADSVNKCAKGQDDALPDCRRKVQLWNGGMVGIYIAVWLFQIFACLIVNDYIKQLNDEELLKTKNPQNV